MNLKFSKYRFLILLCFVISITYGQEEAKIWQKFTGKISNPEIPVLFDYSYAGYKLGAIGVPKKFKNLKVFKVTDFGAIANDTISDQEAIQATINAAEKNKGGIVFFPKGEFLVNVKPIKTNPIEISSSNIILKGSGFGKNGTIINMKNHMLRRTPNEPEWKVSYMFTFSSNKRAKAQTNILKNAKEGDFTIEVENADLFKEAKFIHLEMPYNREAVSESLEGKKPRPHWEKIQEKGVTFIENHEIKSISGNTITLKDPLVNAINTSYNWQAKPFYPLENVGVEDIFFKANFKDKFKHHKDYLHDNAWSIIAMSNVANSWVRRCKFSNITGAVSLGNSYASSILMLLIEGNSGHKLTNVTQSSRILTGLINDKTNYGQWHGASMSHKTSGSVIWRVKTPKQGWDSHADIPKNNLVDLYEGAKMTSHGGNYKNEPHHLKGLTLWNYKRVGKTQENYDYWKLSGARHLYWGFAVVNPNVVGLHGSKTTLEEKNVGYLESLGTQVFPASLYEAQLEHRLGKVPKWICKSLKEWQKIQNN
ncbi:DUF4955 domain-containing protein [Polaribacter sp. IC073]|uniref:DUF4955 domain-containing protein n=1 Tax=Polaribacter sp. IC073 TaxID=2508540 RepID=UPI0011BD5FA9|nr:DUF4955 domain-containing protein [Polaribacter sp. IC073]TXD46767.1 DUF4955 domain-containing protein [Polaribacter sp. IC073]